MLRIEGPTAPHFVDLLQRHSGLSLTLQEGLVTVDTTVPANPYCSATLRDLVREMAGPGPEVRITARGGRPAGVGPLDSFFGTAQVRARSVFTRDLDVIEQHCPELAAALLGHVLGEYLSAVGARFDLTAGPQRVERAQFAPHHIEGLRAEAAVIEDLTGRPAFRNGYRPMEGAGTTPQGRTILVHTLGPGNRYYIHLGPPPVEPIIGVTHTR